MKALEPLLTFLLDVGILLQKLMLLKHGDVQMLDTIHRPRWLRPAVLYTCHQNEDKALSIFGVQNVIALSHYQLAHLFEEWAMKCIPTIKHLRLVWSADSDARIGKGDVNQVFPWAILLA